MSSQIAGVHLVPREIAVCPKCDADVEYEVDEWGTDNFETARDEDWMPESIRLQCVREPDIDSDEWDDFDQSHYSTPYIDWLPVEERVLAWVQDSHRAKKETDPDA